jgi:hypothetical protein
MIKQKDEGLIRYPSSFSISQFLGTSAFYFFVALIAST